MAEHNDPGQQGWPSGPQQPQYPGGYGQASAPDWGSHPPPGQLPGPGSSPAGEQGGAQSQALGSFVARPRTRLAFLIGAFLGVVLGGGGVALGWFAATAGQPDVNAACAALARTESFDPVNDPVGLFRWGAAAAMAQTAAEADPQYQALYDAIYRPLAIHSQTFSTEGPEFADAVAKAREACGR
jgi:hypothetical protein